LKGAIGEFSFPVSSWGGKKGGAWVLEWGRADSEGNVRCRLSIEAGQEGSVKREVEEKHRGEFGGLALNVKATFYEQALVDPLLRSRAFIEGK